ncbi:MAG: hypothetical protein NFCOHLIN_01904 [Gammaproteobacteria bacterium]|nr:hypothetical protein [Gammaproteobacteria bacterium]
MGPESRRDTALRVIAMIDTAALSDQELLLFIELRHMCERTRAANARVEQIIKREQRPPSAPSDPAASQCQSGQA